MIFNCIATVIALLAGSAPVHGKCLIKPDDNGHVEWPTNKKNEVHKNSFKNCLKLRTINLPAGLRYIQKNAFRGCKNLKTIKIPAGVELVYSSSFFKTGMNMLVVAASAQERVSELERLLEVARQRVSELEENCGKTSTIPSVMPSAVAAARCATASPSNAPSNVPSTPATASPSKAPSTPATASPSNAPSTPATASPSKAPYPDYLQRYAQVNEQCTSFLKPQRMTPITYRVILKITETFPETKNIFNWLLFKDLDKVDCFRQLQKCDSRKSNWDYSDKNHQFCFPLDSHVVYTIRGGRPQKVVVTGQWGTMYMRVSGIGHTAEVRDHNLTSYIGGVDNSLIKLDSETNGPSESCVPYYLNCSLEEEFWTQVLDKTYDSMWRIIDMVLNHGIPEDLSFLQHSIYLEILPAISQAQTDFDLSIVPPVPFVPSPENK